MKPPLSEDEKATELIERLAEAAGIEPHTSASSAFYMLVRSGLDTPNVIRFLLWQMDEVNGHAETLAFLQDVMRDVLAFSTPVGEA